MIDGLDGSGFDKEVMDNKGEPGLIDDLSVKTQSSCMCQNLRRRLVE